MRCPSCDADITDEAASTCPECGVWLSDSGGEVTEGIDPPGAGDETRDLAASKTEQSDVPESPVAVVRRARLGEWASDFGRSWTAGGWPEAVSAAAVGFLAVLLVGTVLVVAAKVSVPDLGAGASPLSVVKAIVILSLGTLGAPINLDGLEISAIPLGALLAAGLMISWAARLAVLRRPADSLRGRALDGAKVGVPFGIVCMLAALIFRFDGTHPVSVDPGAALVWGWLWGGAFGALGGLVATSSLRRVFASGLKKVRDRRPVVYEGVMTALVMLISTGALALASGLLWAIVALARGGPSGDFGAADALAAVVYVASFSINVVVSIVALSLGASIEIGQQITLAGRVVGSVREFSLFEWGNGDVPWYVYGVVLVPIFSTLVGGISARRNTSDPTHGLAVLATAAAFFALTLGIVAWLGEARLGAGLVRERGFGRVAPDAAMVFVLGFVWAALGGLAGWALGSSRSRTRG